MHGKVEGVMMDTSGSECMGKVEGVMMDTSGSKCMVEGRGSHDGYKWE